MYAVISNANIFLSVAYVSVCECDPYSGVDIAVLKVSYNRSNNHLSMSVCLHMSYHLPEFSSSEGESASITRRGWRGGGHMDSLHFCFIIQDETPP